MDKKPIARFCLHCEAYIEDLSLNVCPECGAEFSYDATERIHTLTQFEKDDYVGAVDPVTGLVYLPARYKELQIDSTRKPTIVLTRPSRHVHDDGLLFGVAPESEFDWLNSEKSFASRRLSDDRVELYSFEQGYIGTFEQLKYDHYYCSPYVSVRKNGKWGLVDVNGCEVLPQIYDAWVTCIEDSLYDTGKVACLHDDSECFLYDLEGKKISDQAYCCCYSMAGLIYAETIDGAVDFFDFQGNQMDVTDKVQIGSEDFKSSVGRRLAVEVFKFSEEVCVDEDSGDVVTLERRDAVAAIDEVISDELIQELMSTENIQQYAYVWKEPVRGSDWQLWYRRIL